MSSMCSSSVRSTIAGMADKLCATGVRYTSPSFDYLLDINDPFGRMNPGIVSLIIDRMQALTSLSSTCRKSRADERVSPSRMRRLLPLAFLAYATAASAHLIVDMGVAMSAPAFAASGSDVTYTIIVTDYAYDLGVGIVLTDTLPANAEFVSASGTDFICTQ